MELVAQAHLGVFADHDCTLKTVALGALMQSQRMVAVVIQEALVRMVPRGDQRAIAMLCVFLEHEEDFVRAGAIVALGVVTEKGRQRLDHPSSDVRLAALQALAQVSTTRTLQLAALVFNEEIPEAQQPFVRSAPTRLAAIKACTTQHLFRRCQARDLSALLSGGSRR